MDGIKLLNKKGFTLVEVLVALVILSIGLLGVAGMQISGMKGNHNAFMRTQAQQYAYEIIDMMRANRTAARAGAYDIDLTDANPNPVVTIAQQDVVEWRRGLSGDSNPASGLPGGQGSIAVAGGDVTVTVQWSEGRLVDDALPSVVVESKL